MIKHSRVIMCLLTNETKTFIEFSTIPSLPKFAVPSSHPGIPKSFSRDDTIIFSAR